MKYSILLLSVLFLGTGCLVPSVPQPTPKTTPTPVKNETAPSLDEATTKAEIEQETKTEASSEKRMEETTPDIETGIMEKRDDDALETTSSTDVMSTSTVEVSTSTDVMSTSTVEVSTTTDVMSTSTIEVSTSTDIITTSTEMTEDDATTTTTTDDTIAAAVAVSLDASNFTYVDSLGMSNPTITVSAGAEVTVTMNIAGGFHDFVIDELGVQSEAIDSGSTSVTFTPTTPGTYSYYCSVGSHRASGMEGTIIVE
jgi:plastocyanin